tara:strand:- start:2764 stop:2865 length:102 start_codon:yes stop_codon:yes gene_type:complete
MMEWYYIFGIILMLVSVDGVDWLADKIQEKFKK